MHRLLEGVKVVDCTLAGSGPSCTKLLTEYGAQTIWVEPPEGTSTRCIFKFDFYTTGKRSIALDLKTPEGKMALWRFIRDTDVFVSNYRAHALKKLGLTYEDLTKINPRLVYATITGFGEEGPDAGNAGYDPVAFWSRGGMLQDYAEKGQLLVPPIAVGDITAGHALAGGICAALYHRERTGKGSRVFTSLLAQAVYLNHSAIIECQLGQEYPKSRLSPRCALHNTYRCADNQWLFLAIKERFEELFPALLQALGLEGLQGDSRWRKIEDTMHEHSAELVAILDEAFELINRDEVLNILSSSGVPVGKVQSTTEMMCDPRVLESKYLFNIIASDGKKLTIPADPVKFGDKSSGTKDFRRGPRLGEHSLEILREYGYSETEITSLLAKKIVLAEPQSNILHNDNGRA